MEKTISINNAYKNSFWNLNSFGNRNILRSKLKLSASAGKHVVHNSLLFGHFQLRLADRPITGPVFKPRTYRLTVANILSSRFVSDRFLWLQPATPLSFAWPWCAPTTPFFRSMVALPNPPNVNNENFTKKYTLRKFDPKPHDKRPLVKIVSQIQEKKSTLFIIKSIYGKFHAQKFPTVMHYYPCVVNSVYNQRVCSL